MTPLKRWFPIVVLGLLSCTIVEDEDITSAEEAANLSLKSFTISQKTATGNGTLELRQLYDSVQNFTDATTNTKITRKIGYSIPAVGNLKLKLRSGSTLATSLHITYTDFKKPYTAYIQQNDSIIEIYRFRYSAAKQLNRIITIINKVDNLPPTVRTNDTLIYNSEFVANKIGTLNRRIGGVTTPYKVSYRTNNNDSFVTSLQLMSGNTSYIFQQNGQSSGGDGCNSPDCDPYQRTSQGSNGNAGSIYISGLKAGNALINLNLRDSRPSNSGNAPRQSDTYYFHPTMVLVGQHTDGDDLLAMYMLDWWIPGAQTSTNPLNNDENVTLAFNF